MLIGEEFGGADRGTAIPIWLRPALTGCESSKRRIIATRSASDIIATAYRGELNTVKVECHASIFNQIFRCAWLHGVCNSSPIDEAV